jgi:hypothetical protein
MFSEQETPPVEGLVISPSHTPIFAFQRVTGTRMQTMLDATSKGVMPLRAHCSAAKHPLLDGDSAWLAKGR